MLRGKARPESGKSVTVVTVADSDSLRYLAEKEQHCACDAPVARTVVKRCQQYWPPHADCTAQSKTLKRCKHTRGISCSVYCCAPCQTHPWRLRDARTGSLLLTYVAEQGQRLLQVPAGVGAAAEEAPESQRFHGEDDTDELGYGAGVDDVDGQVCRIGAVRGFGKGEHRAVCGKEVEGGIRGRGRGNINAACMCMRINTIARGHVPCGVRCTCCASICDVLHTPMRRALLSHDCRSGWRRK